jgi:hypothetical protein
MGEIDIQWLHEAGSNGGSHMGWYAKGHHDTGAFAAQVNHDYALNASDKRYCSPEKVEHVWWRTVLIAGDPGQYMFAPSNPGRGAWKATVFQW